MIVDPEAHLRHELPGLIGRLYNATGELVIALKDKGAIAVRHSPELREAIDALAAMEAWLRRAAGPQELEGSAEWQRTKDQ